MNKVLLFGRLGTDPELKEVGQEGTTLCKFRMATSERVKRGDQFVEETEWHSVTIWGKRGAAVAKHLSKGDRIMIEGRLHTNSYEDREGVKRYSTEVVATNFEFASDKKKSGAQGADREEDWSYGDEDDPAAPPRSSSGGSRGGR